MSIIRDMKKYMLQKKEKVRTPSGAEKWIWHNVEEIDAAVYLKTQFATTASARYQESTHIGLTFCRKIESGLYRLIRGGKAYQITFCDPEHRIVNLGLKEVDADV